MIRSDVQLISADDHVVEHPRVWLDRLPAKFHEAGPHIAEAHDDDAPGQQIWLYEGRVYPCIGLNAVAGKPREEYGVEPLRFDDMRPGCYDPAERVKDMDADGVHAQVCFPTVPRFAGTLFLEGDDKELALACVQAWNDFMIDEWCGYDPSRQIPQAILPLWDPHLAAAETVRVATKGAKAVSLPENTFHLGLASFHTEHWHPMWAAIQDADLGVSMHFGTSGKIPMTSDDAPMPVWISTMACNSMMTLADLAFSDVFHRFPRLRVSLAEGGIGWIPYLLERMDYVWERHRYYTGIDFDTRPSDLYRRHVWGCFIDDVAGIAMRETIGIDRIMWESDYPHSDGTWPDSRKRLDEVLTDVPEDDCRRIAETNAREFFRFEG